MLARLYMAEPLPVRQVSAVVGAVPGLRVGTVANRMIGKTLQLPVRVQGAGLVPEWEGNRG